ncbi:lasso peptide biosynthesis B2 protein [Streptomyces sp. NPDC018059]|uniref:lasso peptide biosynthesis B2 protein n=1 Tax=Streptomyces sp. NPDC018059 TaxID=3365041 RepID=UPI0037946B9A
MVPGVRGHVPWRRRSAVLVATAAARLIFTVKPHRIRRVLSAVRRGAAPATTSQVLAAREAVVALSARCAGENCLQRSVTTALLCRMRGVWPDWCTGVRTAPFRAHAWVEVGRRVDGRNARTDGRKAYAGALTTSSCRGVGTA